MNFILGRTIAQRESGRGARRLGPFHPTIATSDLQRGSNRVLRIAGVRRISNSFFREV